MEKKQGCIDWLVEEINKQKAWADPSKLEPLFEQAKAMHKEESELIFECGRNFQLTGEGTFNEVYNETFGGENG
jgi:hypothetical protein